MNHSNHSGLVTSYDIVCNHWFRVQGMACCLFGNKSLPKPILTSSQWNLFEQFQWKFNQYFNAIKCIWKCLQIVGHFNVPPNRKISHRNFCQWKAQMPGIKKINPQIFLGFNYLSIPWFRMLQKAKELWNNYQSALHINIMSLHMEMLAFPLTGPCERNPA